MNIYKWTFIFVFKLFYETFYWIDKFIFLITYIEEFSKNNYYQLCILPRFFLNRKSPTWIFIGR